LQVPAELGGYPLREQFVRYDNDETEMRHLHDIPWPKVAVPIEIEAGGVIVFNGLLPHYRAPNLSLTSHLTCANTRYAKENWVQTLPKTLF